MIKYGEKITEFCKGTSCIHYKTIVDLSNNAGLKSNVKCPKIFCDKTWFKEQEEKKEIKIENKNQIELILNKLKDFYKDKKLRLEIYWDIDKDNKMVSFFNPMNQTPTPLTWPNKYIENTNIEQLKLELDDFFQSFLIQFKDEDQKKNCEKCLDENTNLLGMNCIDCSRNKDSKAIIKRDRFRGE